MISEFFRRVLAASAAAVFLFCLLANQQANAQAATFDGYWFPIFHEDNLERGQGPPAGDYTCIPLNEAGRLRAATWDPIVRAFYNYFAHVIDTYSLRDFVPTTMMPGRAASNHDSRTTGARAEVE